MAQKVQVRVKREKDETNVQDVVLFMTAYNFHGIKKRFSPLSFLKRAKGIFREFHISSISNEKNVITRSGRIEYSLTYNPLIQRSNYQFNTDKIKDKQLAEKELEDLRWVLPLRHAERVVLAGDEYHISYCINMDSFLVRINDEVLQVDPVVFAMNDLLFVSYEMIHYDSGRPFSYKEIFGKKQNYNIIPVTSLRYFDSDDFIEDDRKVSDIIFDNVKSFIEKLLKRKYQFGDYSFVHNTFVLSNQVSDVDTYFQLVLGADLPELRVKNLSTQSQYQFYSTEFLGVVCNVETNEADHVFYECLLLEAVKMMLCLEMIVDYDVTEKLNHLLDRQIYIEHLYYPSYAPIVTLNAIENIKQTATYKRYMQAVHFKIDALKLKQERQRTVNGRLLNILLYVLAALGGLQVMDILEHQFGWSFKWGFIVEIVIFGGLGLVWYLKEKKE